MKNLIRKLFGIEDNSEELMSQIKKLNELLKEQQERNEKLFCLSCTLQKDFSKKGEATACIEKVMRKGIEWFDYQSLPESDRRQYAINARSILLNDVFKNEVRRLMALWVEHSVKSAASYEEVNAMRMCINALELLRERLESMDVPPAGPEEEDLFEPI